MGAGRKRGKRLKLSAIGYGAVENRLVAVVTLAVQGMEPGVHLNLSE